MTFLPEADITPETIAFGPLEIAFDQRVLRPRPWTVEQSRWASELLIDLEEGPVTELCAGAGQIGLLAVVNNDRELVLVDSNEVACEYSTLNAEHAGMAERVGVRQAKIEDAFEPAERFALVLADPPWVPTSHISDFPDDPQFTIDGGQDGLDLARTCVTAMSRHLGDGGSGLLQLGNTEQAAQLAAWLDEEHPDLGLSLKDVRSFESHGVVLLLSRATV